MSPVDRRTFLKAGGVLAGAAALPAIPSVARASAPVHPYFPRGGRFSRLYVINDADMNSQEAVLVGTLQGLVARDPSAGTVVSAGLPHIYVNSPNSTTEVWLTDLQQNYDVTATPIHSAWDLLAAYQPHGITGYVLYEDDPSVSGLPPWAASPTAWPCTPVWRPGDRRWVDENRRTYAGRTTPG